MTREEAIKMTKAALECMERDVSGCDEMCNCRKCYDCNLNYEKGNMGEQKEWLRLAIKALEQEPCEDCGRSDTKMNVDELISIIIEMGENEVKELELPPSDLSDVVYTICCDIKHGVYVELKRRGIIHD